MTLEEWRVYVLACVRAFDAGDGYALNLLAKQLAEQDAKQDLSTGEGLEP